MSVPIFVGLMLQVLAAARPLNDARGERRREGGLSFHESPGVVQVGLLLEPQRLKDLIISAHLLCRV